MATNRRRRTPFPWGQDRPTGPCKVCPLDPKADIEMQIDRALWKFGTKDKGIVAIWLPGSFGIEMPDKVAGIPINYTESNIYPEIWVEMAVE